MAKISLIFQGLVENGDHENYVNQLLKSKNIENVLISVAFMRSSGIKKIQSNLEKVSKKTKLFVGIRNNITSIQAISMLLDMGIKPYLVDTASNSRVFHPKIYAAYNENKAYLILGSANLTSGGMSSNLEASSFIEVDRNEDEYIDDIIRLTDSLIADYPKHVFQIKSIDDAKSLLKEGRLEDERKTIIPQSKKAPKDRDILPPIPTFQSKRKKPKLEIQTKHKERWEKNKDFNNFFLVWQSNKLKRRTLNIPTQSNTNKKSKTNKTGDMNLGMGLMDKIDFRSYFREEVFNQLEWQNSQKSPHLERAVGKFEIIIKGSNYGEFPLEITHDPRTDTKSYNQKNAMTKIKWDEAKKLIAKEDLLDRFLKIYKKSNGSFLITID